MSDTFNALCTALASEREDTSYKAQEPPQFNRERRSRLPLQTEGLDCAFFFAACNVIGAIVGRTNDCTLQEAQQLRALARDLLWSGGTSQESLATAQAEGEETLRRWCNEYGECRTHTLPEPTESANQRHPVSQGCAPSRKRHRRQCTTPVQPQTSGRTAQRQRQTTVLSWLRPTAARRRVAPPRHPAPGRSGGASAGCPRLERRFLR